MKLDGVACRGSLRVRERAKLGIDAALRAGGQLQPAPGDPIAVTLQKHGRIIIVAAVVDKIGVVTSAADMTTASPAGPDMTSVPSSTLTGTTPRFA
ncbi:hypothetical protein [Sphingomonas mucosissima]|uniref:hypothetical protein n=1 Tax=Sphingomonas mucosissima TaxID=370959 RepID=UPI000B4BFA2C|nr:hypothetical protein [Sphingomonas mucosissima]